MKRFLILFIVLGGCSGIFKPYKVENTFERHVQTFRDEASMRGLDYPLSDNLIIKMDKNLDRSDPFAAVTTSRHPRVIRIHVNAYYWARSNTLEREILIMHELGHGRLDRDHDWLLDCDENSITIMIVALPAEKIMINYKVHRDKMLNELFGVKPTLAECRL